jgi:glycosyltransferase involved in cell wall biosynthesis
VPKNIIHLSNFSKNKISNSNYFNEVVIFNSISPKFFDIPFKVNTSNKLLYIGIVDNNKNLLFLLKILKSLVDQQKNFFLDVLGGFSNVIYEKEIFDFIKSNNLENNVSFKGWVLQSEVLFYLNNSDILVVSSKHESLPMVIAESMAAGKVVLASDVGGIPEMINSGFDGFLFNLNQPEKLIEMLSKLHDNFQLVSTLSKNAKDSAFEKFNSTKIAKKTLDFYYYIISEKNKQ